MRFISYDPELFFVLFFPPSLPSVLPIALLLKATHHTRHRGGKVVGHSLGARAQWEWIQPRWDQRGLSQSHLSTIACTLNQSACISEFTSSLERFIYLFGGFEEGSHFVT